jgi:ABC-type nitrate/sulfonate/bicarbonate transport system permease component
MAGIDQGLGAMLIMGRSLGNISIVVLAAALIALTAFSIDRCITMVGTTLVRTRFGGWLHSDVR